MQLILSDSWLYSKAAQIGADKVFEQHEKDKYKDLVHTKVIRPVEDLKDIKLSIHTTLSEFKELYEFSGWVKGSEVEDSTEFIKENRALLKENIKLKELLDKQASKKKIGNFEYVEIKRVLKSKEITIPKGKLGNDEELTVDYLTLFISLRDIFSTGIENSSGTRDDKIYVYYNIAPSLMSFGLLEKVKVAGVRYERIQTSKEGLKFLACIDIEKTEKNKTVAKK